MKTLRCTQSFFAFAMLFLLFSCNTNKEGKIENLEIPILNIEDLLNPNIKSSFTKDVEVESIIPLETTDKSLLGSIVKVMKSGDLLFIRDTESDLKVFNTEGKFQGTIGKEGQGPGEYVNFTDFAIDDKNKDVYINSLKKTLIYDFDGNFKREFSLDNMNLQVVTYFKEKLFYIYPYKFEPANVKSIPIVSIFDLEGKKEKDFLTYLLRRGNGFTYFNAISSDKNGVYYKEEIGKTLYTIKDDFSLDSLCHLDFGKYAFQEDDYTFEKLQNKTDQYRLYNILPADDYMIFILQKGLMAEKLVPVFWDKKENTICHFDIKVEYKGKEFTVLPLVITENKVIAKLIDTDEELDSDNPVFVVLRVIS